MTFAHIKCPKCGKGGLMIDNGVSDNVGVTHEGTIHDDTITMTDWCVVKRTDSDNARLMELIFPGR